MRTYLVGLGMHAASVPFQYEGVKMVLLKGEAALAARRHVASKLTSMAITELQRPRRAEAWAAAARGLHDRQGARHVC